MSLSYTCNYLFTYFGTKIAVLRITFLENTEISEEYVASSFNRRASLVLFTRYFSHSVYLSHILAGHITHLLNM